MAAMKKIEDISLRNNAGNQKNGSFASWPALRPTYTGRLFMPQTSGFGQWPAFCKKLCAVSGGLL